MNQQEPEVYQQQDPQQSMNIYPSPSVPIDRGDLLDKIKPENLIIELRYRLMGYTKQKGEWIKDPRYEGMSLTYTGATDVLNVLVPICSQNANLSDLEDEEIKMITLSMVKVTVNTILANWRDYKITNKAKIGEIVKLVQHTCFITLKESQNQGIRDLVMNTSKWNNTLGMGGGGEKEKSWLQKLLRR